MSGGLIKLPSAVTHSATWPRIVSFLGRYCDEVAAAAVTLLLVTHQYEDDDDELHGSTNYRHTVGDVAARSKSFWSSFHRRFPSLCQRTQLALSTSGKGSPCRHIRSTRSGAPHRSVGPTGTRTLSQFGHFGTSLFDFSICDKSSCARATPFDVLNQKEL